MHSCQLKPPIFTYKVGKDRAQEKKEASCGIFVMDVLRAVQLRLLFLSLSCPLWPPAHQRKARTFFPFTRNAQKWLLDVWGLWSPW